MHPISRHLLVLCMALGLTGCGKKDAENNEVGPCGGPDMRSCVCSDDTQGTQSCDADTAQYGDCMCTSMSIESNCCIGAQFYDCPSALTAGACFDNEDPGACTRDPSRDAECASTPLNNSTNNGTPLEEEDDPLCWANCRDGHEACAASCGGGATCWELCEEDHELCATRCGGGEVCSDRCDAGPTECAARCG